jgi:hypothetical protein
MSSTSLVQVDAQGNLSSSGATPESIQANAVTATSLAYSLDTLAATLLSLGSRLKTLEDNAVMKNTNISLLSTEYGGRMCLSGQCGDGVCMIAKSSHRNDNTSIFQIIRPPIKEDGR